MEHIYYLHRTLILTLVGMYYKCFVLSEWQQLLSVQWEVAKAGRAHCSWMNNATIQQLYSMCFVVHWNVVKVGRLIFVFCWKTIIFYCFPSSLKKYVIPINADSVRARAAQGWKRWIFYIMDAYNKPHFPFLLFPHISPILPTSLEHVSVLERQHGLKECQTGGLCANTIHNCKRIKMCHLYLSTEAWL